MSSSESKPLSTSPSQLSSTLSSLAAVPPQPQKEPPRPPPLQQGGQGKTGAARKPKKKRSSEEREQRRKRLAEKEKAIASLEEKIRNLKLEIEKSKAELSDTTRKASIVCQATQTVDPGHVMRMREVFSSNATAEQAPKPERAYQYDKAGTIPEAQASGLPEVSRPVPKILRAAPLPPNYEAPPPPVPLVGPQKHRPVSKAFSTMINDKNKVTITFINPEPYSKKRPSITHKFSDRYTYDEVIKEYWEMATPEISKDILYDTYQKILQERNFAVSCSLVQVEEKSLAPLFQIHEDKNLSLNFFKALIDMEIQRCKTFKELVRKTGVLYFAFSTYFQLCAKAFISKALSPGLNCLIERNDDLACIKRDLDTFSTAAGPEGVDLSRSAGYISSAIVVIMESIINEMHSIPDEVVALGSYLWRAAKVKFPYVKSNHVGGFIFSRLIGPSLLSPESISTANIAGDKSKENAIDGLKTVTKIILAACSPKFSIRDSFFPYIEKEVDVTCDKIPDSEAGKDNEKMKVESFKCASRDTLENHLMWVQTLMRTYPDNFKKSMYFSVKAIKPPTFKDGIMKTYYDYVKSGLAKADRTREMLNRNHIHMEELPEQDQGIEIPNEPIENVNIVENDDLYKRTQEILYKKLHPKYNYHTKVHDTDHYISEDPEFAKKPLSSWGFIDRDQKTGSGSVTLELVDNSVLDGDKYIGSQIARITGSEYNWSSFNDEAYLFSQMLFKATPHINREYPITKVAFTNAAFPSHLATTFDVVVYPPQLPQVSKEEGEEGSAKAAKKEENEPQGPVTCLCTTETVAQKLFCDALAKLNVSMAPSSVAFKCVGLELYLLPSETAPVANCTYVRNRLRRKKEVSFVVVPINELVLESPLDIKFEKFAVPKPDKSTVFSSITVQHRLEINVRSASNIVLNQVNGMTPRLFVEAAIYYGGQKISKSTCTPLEKLVTEPTATTTATTDGSNVVGNHTWDTWIGFDLTISQLPRESRVCLTLYSTHGESSEQQQQQQQQQQLQQQAQLQSQDKDQAGGEQGQSKDDQLQQEQLQQQQQQQLLSQKQQQQQYDVDLSTQALELLEDSQKEAIAWTSFRIFDHRSRLISGTHSLQLLKGKANPIGICVHAMNLHNSAYLKLTFPSGPVIVYPQDEDFPQQQQSGADAAGKRQPSKGEEAILDQIINSDSLSTLSDSDKSLLWQYRHTLKSKPCSIMKLLLSTPWTDYKAVSEVHSMLKDWELIDPIRALELLDGKFPDTCAREYAVRCLEKMSINDLDGYMMQLVQALKCETYHSSALAIFLLETAINNRLPIGHTFFLMLKAEMHIPEVRERFLLLLKCYLRASGHHRDNIIRQLDLIDTLMVVNKTKSFQALESFPFCEHFYLPHDPTLCVSRLIPEKCKVLDSARAPLWLAFENADKLSKAPVCVLFKAADDLRQDMLALQAIRLMDKFWEDGGLDMRLTLYKCVALGPAVGMIEVVPDCTTIADIQKLMGGGVTSAFKEKTIAEWLRKKNPDKVVHEEVVETFTYSLAGYCVATYLLGVGDRHNDNIMLCSDGHLFHIDFGHILGNAEKWKGIKRDRAPFVLTPEFAYVMGGKRNTGFAKFCDVGCEAYNLIRKYSSTFITLFTMMLYTDIPELRGEEDIYYLKSALNTDKEEPEAKAIFKGLISQSLSTKMTRINNAIHIAVHSHINEAHDTILK